MTGVRPDRLDDLIVRPIGADAHRTAVVSVAGEHDYAWLWKEIRRVQAELDAAGVRPGDRVALVLPRSAEYVVCLFAVWCAHAAAVPVDPDLPPLRQAHIIEATRPAVVLRAAAPGAPWPVLDTPAGTPCAGPDHVALILFTSGSTGTPKGVVLGHAALVNRLRWGRETYGFDHTDRVLHKASSGFDASLHELFEPLMAGGCLVIAPPGTQYDSLATVRLMRSAAVTVAHFVPSVLRYVVEEDDLADCTDLRWVFCGGEPLDRELVRRFADALPCPLVNQYGPTEAAIDVTHWDCRRAFTSAVAPLGDPVGGVRLHVLDAGQRLVPDGMPGELWIGGVALADGYLDLPELTADRFRPDPFTGSGRMYRTGDRVVRSSGTLEFRGRADDQVKIRGVRVEPGEVAAVLRAHGSVRDAAVVAAEREESGELALHAYVVAAPGAQATVAAELRAYLADRLPLALRPSTYHVVDRLPRSSSGKLSTSDLRASVAEAAEADPDDQRRELREVWRTELAVGMVRDEDSFLALGGHSLLALRVARRVGQLRGTPLAAMTCLQAPTFARWADLVEGER